jgi:hypothetical protein
MANCKGPYIYRKINIFYIVIPVIIVFILIMLAYKVLVCKVCQTNSLHIDTNSSGVKSISHSVS